MEHFEAFRTGDHEQFGSYVVTREEVLEFALRYDPTPSHLDDGIALENPIFGRLAASGIHTLAMMNRMLVDHWRGQGRTAVASPGFKVAFLKPVYPGDALQCELLVTECKISQSKPDLGRVTFTIIVYNQQRTAVLQVDGSSLHRRRDSGAFVD